MTAFVATAEFIYQHPDGRRYRAVRGQLFTSFDDASLFIHMRLRQCRPAFACPSCHRYLWWIAPGEDRVRCGRCGGKRPSRDEGTLWFTGWSVDATTAVEKEICGQRVTIVELPDEGEGAAVAGVKIAAVR